MISLTEEITMDCTIVVVSKHLVYNWKVKNFPKDQTVLTDKTENQIKVWEGEGSPPLPLWSFFATETVLVHRSWSCLLNGMRIDEKGVVILPELEWWRNLVLGICIVQFQETRSWLWVILIVLTQYFAAIDTLAWSTAPLSTLSRHSSLRSHPWQSRTWRNWLNCYTSNVYYSSQRSHLGCWAHSSMTHPIQNILQSLWVALKICDNCFKTWRLHVSLFKVALIFQLLPFLQCTNRSCKHFYLKDSKEFVVERRAI